MKENDRVYLMKVPTASSLPPHPTFSMVKPMPMNEVLDARSWKMFASLVPHCFTESLSRYAEMVDDIVRTQANKLQQGSELANVRLKEMDLPDSILALEGNINLPTSLEDVETVQISGGPAALEVDLQQLEHRRRANQEMLVQMENQLQKKAAEDAQFINRFRTWWTGPQQHNPIFVKNLQDEFKKFQEILKQAAESDARIERSIREHSALMSILDCQPIESTLPSLARPITSLNASADAIVVALKHSLDDILPKLMNSTVSHEDLFRKEISKYDHISEEIAQNLKAQEQLLMHIQSQNDEFAATFNLEDYKASREKNYKQIEAAVAKYQEIKENMGKGFEVYNTSEA